MNKNALCCSTQKIKLPKRPATCCYHQTRSSPCCTFEDNACLLNNAYCPPAPCCSDNINTCCVPYTDNCCQNCNEVYNCCNSVLPTSCTPCCNQYVINKVVSSFCVDQNCVSERIYLDSFCSCSEHYRLTHVREDNICPSCTISDTSPCKMTLEICVPLVCTVLDDKGCKFVQKGHLCKKVCIQTNKCFSCASNIALCAKVCLASCTTFCKNPFCAPLRILIKGHVLSPQVITC